MQHEIGPVRAAVNGLLCLLILGAGGLGAYKVAERNWQVQETAELIAAFPEVSGVELGARVYLQGVEAGIVRSIEPPSQPGGLVQVRIEIDPTLRRLLREDAEARITSRGVVGARVIELNAGSPGSNSLAEDAPIVATQGVDLDDLVSEASQTIAQVNQVARTAEAGLIEIQELTESIRNGEGAIGRLMVDDEPIDQLLRLTEKGERTLDDLEENLDAIKGTWPISRYFDQRGYDDRDLVLYRPSARQLVRSFPEDQLFKPGRAVLSESGCRLLDQLAAWMKPQLEPETEIVIAGFSGHQLDNDMAEILTQRQSEAIRSYLIDRHALDRREWWRKRIVTAVGFGNQIPRTLKQRSELSQPRSRIEVFLFTSEGSTS